MPRLTPLLLLLGACQALPPMLDPSQYICPDGRTVWAGRSEDGRLLRLTLDGRSHTLRRQGDGDSYSNGHYSARLDDLFLRLGIPGTLLPQQCRLMVPGEQNMPAAGTPAR